MGTPDFAVYPLQKLLEAGHKVVAVVTNPDKPAGRGQKIQELDGVNTIEFISKEQALGQMKEIF